MVYEFKSFHLLAVGFVYSARNGSWTYAMGSVYLQTSKRIKHQTGLIRLVHRLDEHLYIFKHFDFYCHIEYVIMNQQYFMWTGMSDSSFLSITVTPTELSIVAEEKYEKCLKPYLISDNIESQTQMWKALRVSGQVSWC